MKCNKSYFDKHRDKDFKYFLKCLKIACKNVSDDYIEISMAGSKDLKFRERVYCYELYHQLRLIFGNDFLYMLHGEMDKKGHEITEDEKIPDFIVHIPGNMGCNLSIIEVKSIKGATNSSNLKKDIEKLKKFIKEAEYYRGIMLIYSDGRHGGIKSIIETVKELIAGYEKHIFLIWHGQPNKEPEIILPEKFTL